MKIVITVPGHLTNNPDVDTALTRLMHLAGGCTICPAQGQWQGPTHLLHEPVEQYHFCFMGPARDLNYEEIEPAYRGAIKALLDAGEQAVLVERFDHRYNAILYTMEDFK